jgi:hypothetical protein
MRGGIRLFVGYADERHREQPVSQHRRGKYHFDPEQPGTMVAPACPGRGGFGFSLCRGDDEAHFAEWHR